MLISLVLSDCSVNGKYVPQGKLGCALLGSHSSKDVGKPMQPRYSSSSIASYLPPLLFPPLPSSALPFLLPYPPFFCPSLIFPPSSPSSSPFLHAVQTTGVRQQKQVCYNGQCRCVILLHSKSAMLASNLIPLAWV